MNPEFPSPGTDALGLSLDPGDAHYRAYVGPPRDYDLVAAMSFCLLTALGLRQQHTVLDVGCGSLRVGRLLVPYLNPGNYTGLEPNAWLVEEGIAREVGQDQVDAKRPRFVHDQDATPLLAEGRKFDFILAQSIFSHCGGDLLDLWISQVRDLLQDGGVLAATFVDGQDNAASGWVYPDCVTYQADTLARMVRAHGLQFDLLDWKHPRQRWMAVTRPGYDTSVLGQGRLSWNAAFDRFNARAQPG